MLGHFAMRLRRLLHADRANGCPGRDPQPAEMEQIFARIHKRRTWGSRESVSGPGSAKARAADFLEELIALLKALDTRVLLDAPCGDFNWAQPMAEAVDRYIGMDVVPDLIVDHQRTKATSGRQFLCGDLTEQALPRADVVFCRDCLVHFSFRDVDRAVRNFQRSGSRYLLTTTFIGRSSNVDISTGGWHPLNLQAPPFSFPPPLAMVDEKCAHTGGIYRDKRLALWTLVDLPPTSRAVRDGDSRSMIGARSAFSTPVQ